MASDVNIVLAISVTEVGRRYTENCRNAENYRKLQKTVVNFGNARENLAKLFGSPAHPSAPSRNQSWSKCPQICPSDLALEVIECSKQGGRPQDRIWALAYDREGKNCKATCKGCKKGVVYRKVQELYQHAAGCIQLGDSVRSEQLAASNGYGYEEAAQQSGRSRRPSLTAFLQQSDMLPEGSHPCFSTQILCYCPRCAPLALPILFISLVGCPQLSNQWASP